MSDPSIRNQDIEFLLWDCAPHNCYGGGCVGEHKTVDIYEGKSKAFYGKASFCDRAMEACRRNGFVVQ